MRGSVQDCYPTHYRYVTSSFQHQAVNRIVTILVSHWEFFLQLSNYQENCRFQIFKVCFIRSSQTYGEPCSRRMNSFLEARSSFEVTMHFCKGGFQTCLRDTNQVQKRTATLKQQASLADGRRWQTAHDTFVSQEKGEAELTNPDAETKLKLQQIFIRRSNN